MYLSTWLILLKVSKLGDYIKCLDLPETIVFLIRCQNSLEIVDVWSWWISNIGLEILPIFQLFFF